MKKNYLTPTMAAVEIQFCSLLMASVTGDDTPPDKPTETPPHGAPRRLF